METITASDARANFADILGRVSFGKERIAISRRGKPVALLVPVPEADLTAIGTAERQRHEQALSESGRRLRAISDVAPVGIFHTDAGGDVTYVNQKWCQLGGMTPEAAMGKSWLDTIDPDDREWDNADWYQATNSKKPFEGEYRSVNSDGAITWCLVQSQPEFDAAGDIIGHVGAVTDISERKRAEERFRRYFELPLVGSAIYAPDKKWIAVNDALCDLLGYSREELMEITWPEITHPDDREENLRLFEAALSGTGSDAYSMDKRFIRKDGGVIHAMICAECVRKPDGAPDYFILLVQDITERKRAEKDHLLSAQRLEDITDAASDWFWEMDADLRFTYISDRYEEVAGISSDHFFGKRMDETYPRSVVRYPEAWKPYLETVAARRDFRDFVHDDIRMDGLRRVISSTGKAIFDEDGIFQGYRGTSTDITDQRVAEEALRESEARLSEASRLAKLGTYLWDVVNKQCIHCSVEYAAIHGLTPEYAATHGLTPEEYIARASRIDGEFTIIHPDDREAYRAAMAELRGGKQIEGEWRVVTPAGETRYLYEISRPIFDAEGAVIREYCVAQDITERKQAEAELRDSQARLNDAIESISEAFVLFDSDERLVACNDNYRKMFPLIADTMVPGAKLEDLVRATGERGQVMHDMASVEDWIDKRLQEYRVDRKEPVELHLSDDRWVLASERRTREGGIVGIRVDITERKRAEQELRESEERFRDMTANVPGIVYQFRIDAAGEPSFPYISPAIKEILGIEATDLVADPIAWFDIIHPDDLPGLDASIEETHRTLEPWLWEGRMIRASGEAGWFRGSATPRKQDDGSVLWTGLILDITERKRAEQELRESEELFSRIFHVSPVLFAISRPEDGTHYDVNKAWMEATGYSHEEAIAHSALELGIWADAKQRERFVARLEKEGSVRDFEAKLRTKDGRELDVLVAGEYMVFHGEPRLLVVHHDITERKRAEQELQSSQARLLDAIESFPGGFILYDSEERMILCNSQYRDFYPSIAAILQPGASFKELSRVALAAGAVKGSAENVEAFMEKHTELHNAGQGAYEQQLDDGRWVLCSVRSTADGGIVGIRTDITDVKRAEEAVRTRDAWLKGIMENSPLEIVLKDTTGKIMAISRNVQKAYGLSQEEMVGHLSSDFIPASRVDMSMKADREVIEADRFVQLEVTEEREDGSIRHMLNAKFPLKDDKGLILGSCSFATDITEMKQVQAQLHQAQKMEAVGQLTGGIAHDFNNLLAIVVGNLELIADEAKDGNDLAPYLDAAFSATDDAATLTQRLLAFSRNQPLMPKITDMNGLVSKMIGLFERTLDDNIVIVADFGDELAPVSIDSGQLENALLNLVVNARDAMPKGGDIFIETNSVTVDETTAGSDYALKRGDYISLTVRDTGAGIPQDVLDHVFEPFFTTKEVGEGSGLGLSMVFGFVKQSGGHVTISSTPGRGTAVTLYLPATTARLSDAEKPDPGLDIQGDSKTILLVEDNEQVRRVVVAQLASMGFKVHHAMDGKSALETLEKHPLIDLLLTDVKMPGGMDGAELAREVRRRRPSLPVLYASGYSADALMHSGQLEDNAQLIEKPFKRRALAARITSMLS